MSDQGFTQDDGQWTPPGGELSLDDLFPNPELPQGQAPVTQAPPQGQPEYYLKASTGTVYATHQDAVRGTEEKDRTIERMKAELTQLKTQQTQAPALQTPPAEDYRKTTFKRLAAAAQSGDEATYMDTLAEFQMQTLSQFAPALTGVYEQQAISSIESEVKDFRSWLSSPEYTRTLEQFPALGQAIQMAKSDPRAAHQLNEFYKLAYRAYAGDPTRVSELSTQLAHSAAPASTPTRPTLQQTLPTPVTGGLPQNIGAPYTRDQIMSNREKRTEFLKRYKEERGQSLDRTFGELGL